MRNCSEPISHERETRHVHSSELEGYQLSWIRVEGHKDQCEKAAAADAAQLLSPRRTRFTHRIRQEQRKEYFPTQGFSEMRLISLISRH